MQFNLTKAYESSGVGLKELNKKTLILFALNISATLFAKNSL